jgi:hypothetical protein
MIPDHPDIQSIERTGYPQDNQPVPIYCGECGCELQDDVYEDNYYDYLCERCLLRLHKKE